MEVTESVFFDSNDTTNWIAMVEGKDRELSKKNEELETMKQELKRVKQEHKKECSKLNEIIKEYRGKYDRAVDDLDQAWNENKGLKKRLKFFQFQERSRERKRRDEERMIEEERNIKRKVRIEEIERAKIREELVGSHH
jgi:hypothetical protein